MNNLISKLKNNPKIVLGGVLLAAIVLPIIIGQVLKQQDVRQRASSAPAIILSFSPALADITLQETKTLDLYMNTNGNDIGSLQFKLTYDPTKIELTRQTVGTNFIQLNETNSNGAYEVTLLNPTTTPISGSAIKVATFKVTALSLGETIIKVDPDVKATASTYASYVPLDGGNIIEAKYTIWDGSTSPYPSTTSSPPPSVPPTITFTPTPSQTCSDTGIKSITYPSPNNECAAGTYKTALIECNDGTTTMSTPQTTCQAQGDWPSQEAYTFCASHKTCTSLSPTPTKTPTPTPTLGPTATTVPTATIPPGDTGLNLNIKIPGIGKIAGDNQTPSRGVRTVNVSIFNSSNQAVATDKTGVLSYNSASGKFEGIAGLGNTLTTGSYLVKVKLDNTLTKQLPGIISLTSGSTQNASSEISLVSGDLDQDNELTIQDYNTFLACYKGLSSCTANLASKADFNDNGSAKDDNVDLNILQRGFAVRQGD